MCIRKQRDEHGTNEEREAGRIANAANMQRGKGEKEERAQERKRNKAISEARDRELDENGGAERMEKARTMHSARYEEEHKQ